MHIIKLTFALFSLILSTKASEGDEAWSFHVCVWRCNQTGCTDIPGRDPFCKTACPRFNRLPVPLTLRLAFWTCEDDCKHHCMLESESGRGHANAHGSREAVSGTPKPAPETLKYYGKWPFRRVFGAQEIMSSLLSLGNLFAHVHCFLGLMKLCVRQGQRLISSKNQSGSGNSHASRKNHHRSASHAHGRSDKSLALLVQLGEGALTAYPFLPLWILYTLAHVNAWLWSAVFHVRDTWLTERLDYCSANIVVALSLICVMVRALGTRSKMLTVGGVASVIALVAWHLRYMLVVKFDYGWNMKFCLVLGLVNTITWVLFCQSVQHPHRWRLYSFLTLVYVALLLEVLDFPPFFMLFDAHAAWHAATIPLVYVFYLFLHGDVEWVSALRQLRHNKALS